MRVTGFVSSVIIFVIASEAKQSIWPQKEWIASSLRFSQ